jgi:hypothetical protein
VCMAPKVMMRRLHSYRKFEASGSNARGHGPLGDFNLIYKDEDKNNIKLNRAMMDRFPRLINDLSIKEILLHGRKFTWSSLISGASPTLVKLDRVFCSIDWENQFPDCILQSEATEDSDHCPLILGLNDGHSRKRRFRFESFWPKFEGFQIAVQSVWMSVQAARCPLETPSLKFKAIVKHLQSWSDKNVGNFKHQLGLAKEIVHRMEIARDHMQLHQQERGCYAT